MMNAHRRFSVADIETAQDLADKLARTWCGCVGFRFAGYLFLNDSFSEDGAQEYAIYRIGADGGFEQIESITFGWCSAAERLDYIEQVARGAFTSVFNRDPVRIEAPTVHRCSLCA